jgi:hypothetical protein
MSHKLLRAWTLALVLGLLVLGLSVCPTPSFAQAPSGTPVSTTSTSGEPVPPAGAIKVPNTPDLDKSVAVIAKALSLDNPTYDAWALPTNATADATFKYYGDMLKQAGWTDKGVLGQDPLLGSYSRWKSDDKLSELVVLFIASTDPSTPSVALAILGTTSAKSSAPAGSTAADPYAMPAGKGGIIVKSFYGDEINFDINSKLYKIPGNGEVFIILDPGTYNWSANIATKGDTNGKQVVQPDTLSEITFAD